MKDKCVTGDGTGRILRIPELLFSVDIVSFVEVNLNFGGEFGCGERVGLFIVKVCRDK
ncbi:hypothetical protein Hanom_Chr12g01180481 [Helianthus anomalus]